MRRVSFGLHSPLAKTPLSSHTMQAFIGRLLFAMIFIMSGLQKCVARSRRRAVTSSRAPAYNSDSRVIRPARGMRCPPQNSDGAFRAIQLGARVAPLVHTAWQRLVRRQQALLEVFLPPSPQFGSDGGPTAGYMKPKMAAFKAQIHGATGFSLDVLPLEVRQCCMQPPGAFPRRPWTWALGLATSPP